MISDLYYLLPVLPRLEFDKPGQFNRGEFFEECKKWLGAKEIALLKNLARDETEIKKNDVGSVAEWKRFNLELRQETAGRRKKESKTTGQGDTPLELEKKFEKKRWEYIEDKEKEYNFDMNALILYFLKAQILERLALFNKEKGREIFEGMVKSV
jgi:hypothetical protein